MGRVGAVWAVGLAVVTGLILAPGGPASADRPSLTVRVSAVKGHQVVLRGVSPRASGTVRLQQRTAEGWRTAAVVRVHRHHFRARVAQPRRNAHYRASLGRHHSHAVAARVGLPGRPSTVTPGPSSTAVPTSVVPGNPVPVPSGTSGGTAGTWTPPVDSVSASGGTSPSCGRLLRKADGSLWRCAFDDEFDGTTLDLAKWVPQSYFVSGGSDSPACAENDPDLINVSAGALHLSVGRPKPTSVWAPYCAYTDGMVSTYHTFSFTYGRIEARIKAPAETGPGLHEAFWMWPDDRVSSTLSWPEAGEIDVAEQYSGLPDIAIPYLHYTADDNGGYLPGTNTAFDCSAPRGQFNTFALEWSPTTLTFIINGRTCLVNWSADPAFQKPYIIDFTQTIGEGLNAPDASTSFPATMDVDYVRVWQ